MVSPVICGQSEPLSIITDCDCVVTCEDLTEIRNEITTINNLIEAQNKEYVSVLLPGDTGILVTNATRLIRKNNTVHLTGYLVYDLSATPISDDPSVENRIISDEHLVWGKCPVGFRPHRRTVVAAEEGAQGMSSSGNPYTHDCRISTNLLADPGGNVTMRDNFVFLYHDTNPMKLANQVTIHVSGSWITTNAIPIEGGEI